MTDQKLTVGDRAMQHMASQISGLAVQVAVTQAQLDEVTAERDELAKLLAEARKQVAQ